MRGSVLLLGVLPASGGTADAGGPQDAGPGDAGPDGGSAAADAGLDGGVAADCEGLVPADAGRPLFADLDTGNPAQICSAAPPDGTGTLPLRVGTFDANGVQRTAWSFVRAADGARISSHAYPAGTGPTVLIPQPQGFTGVEPVAADPPRLDLHGINAAGDDFATARTDVAALVPDPSGGVVGFALTRARATFTLRFERFDAGGNLVASAVAATGNTAAPDQPVPFVAGVSVRGDTLLVFGPPDRPCGAVWLDRGGSAVSPVFRPSLCRIRALRPLVDGALAVEGEDQDRNGFIAASVAPRAARFGDAPAWLAGARLRELFLLPRGRGYALRRQGPGARLELFSPAGSRCGELATPGLDDGPFLVGRDGTLVEQDLTGQACSFRWHPALFR
ncbi:MAG TPA: hypothetical protein VFL36_07400 [Myxococcales bacterium]|nr:hypothetical protein [Myxococcales bacterium]